MAANNNISNNNRNYDSAPAYAMSLPELVINVVRFLPASSLRRCSQVSRVWYTSTYSRRLSYGEFATATRELFESSPKKIYVLSTFVLQYSPSINSHHTPSGPYQFVFSCQARGGSMDSYASTNSEERTASSGGSGGSSGDSGTHSHRHHNHQPGHSSVSPHSFHTFQSSAIIPNVFFRSALDFPSYMSSPPSAPPTIVPPIPPQPHQQPHQPHPQPHHHQQQQQQQTELYPQTLVLPPPMTLSIGQQLDMLASAQPHSLPPSNITYPLQPADPVPSLLSEIAELTLSPNQMALARFQSESAQSSSSSSQQQSRQPSHSEHQQRSSSIHIVPCPFEYASDGSISFDEGGPSSQRYPSRGGRHNSGSDNSQRSRSDSSSDSMGTSGEIMFGAISTSAPHESSSTMQSHIEALHAHQLPRKGKGRATEYGSYAPHVTDSSEHSEVLLSESDPLEMHSGDNSSDRRGSSTTAGTTSSSSFGQPPDLSRSRGRGAGVFGTSGGSSASLGGASSSAGKGKGKGSRRSSTKTSPGPQLPNWSMALGTYYYYMMAKNAMVVACRKHMESEQGQGAHIVEMTETTRIVWNDTTSQEHIWTITPTLMDRTNPGDRVEKDYDPHAEMEARSGAPGTMRGWMSPRLMGTVAEMRGEQVGQVEDEEELDEEDTYEEDEEDNGDDDGDTDMI